MAINSFIRQRKAAIQTHELDAIAWLQVLSQSERERSLNDLSVQRLNWASHCGAGSVGISRRMPPDNTRVQCVGSAGMRRWGSHRRKAMNLLGAGVRTVSGLAICDDASWNFSSLP